MSQAKAKALGKAEFWDERYKKLDKDEAQPSHEWFRSFEALEPWFKKHLFDVRGPDKSGPIILNLGSGDSVSLKYVAVEIMTVELGSGVAISMLNMYYIFVRM
jgi:hypothetical protein